MSQPGRGEPVCQCRELDAMLAAYVDGESATRDCERVRTHVAACPPCRDRLAGERAAREAVLARRQGLRAAAPDPLKARCAMMARSTPVAAAVAKTSRAGLIRRWAPLSVAATLVLAVATVFTFGLNNKVQALAFQTTLDHVKCSRMAGAAAPADPVDSARQWQARYGWPIVVPPSSVSSSLEFRDVRRCAVTDGRVAHLMYSWLGEPLSVYVLPKATVQQSAAFVHRFRHNSIIWSQNERTYIMVTPHRRDPSLDRVVAYVRATAF